MKINIFLDSNILVYLLLEPKTEIEKQKKIEIFLSTLNENKIYISTQIINETYNVLLKNKMPENNIQDHLKGILKEVNLILITEKSIEECWKLRIKHKFSYYDSMILASALESECFVLYSEDMQHNYKVGKNLIIKNPFIEF